MSSRNAMRRMDLSVWFCGMLSLFLIGLAPASTVQAHPLDVYLQATYITIMPTEIRIELSLTPGVLIAPEVLAQLDANGDQQFSSVEGQAYADQIARQILVQVDHQSLPLDVMAVELPTYLNLQAGYGTIQMMMVAQQPPSPDGSHQLFYRNGFVPTGAAYQVNMVIPSDLPIRLGKPTRDDDQQSITIDYTIDAAALVGSATPTQQTSNPASTSSNPMLDHDQASQVPGRQLIGYLNAPLQSPWMLLLGLILAGVLGGFHALTPGHGKTLVAAYLIGSRGTVQHAIVLGTVVTITHTASVIGIGLLALAASQVFVPELLVPLLEMVSGLLVVGMGIRLVWQRWMTARGKPSNHHHDYGRDDDPYTHDHGDGHRHTHSPTELQRGNLIALGVSGGLVPCPEALGIMIIAIGLNRIGLGLGLIIAFSFGLATVLIIIGILLVRSRAFVDRVAGIGSRWSQRIPLWSAIVVTVLGMGIMLRGIVAYLHQ